MKLSWNAEKFLDTNSFRLTSNIFSLSVACLVTLFVICFTTCTCSGASDSLRPHGLQPARLLCPWDSPGKNTGVGCHAFLLFHYVEDLNFDLKVFLLFTIFVCDFGVVLGRFFSFFSYLTLFHFLRFHINGSCLNFY